MTDRHEAVALRRAIRHDDERELEGDERTDEGGDGERQEHERSLGPLSHRASIAARAAPVEPHRRASVYDDRVMNRSALLANATALHRAGRLDEAARVYEAVIKANPRDPDALNLLGVVAYQRGDFASAIERIKKAIKHGADGADVHVNLGAAYRGAGQMAEAVRHYETALKKRPDAVDAHNNLGNALVQLGEMARARTHLERALALSGGAPDVASNLLYALNFDDRLAAAEIATRHVEWGRTMRAAPRPPRRVRPDGSPLRVGFVSADLRTHSVSFFLLPLFRALDRTKVRVLAFSSGVRHDATTERLRAVTDEWHDIAGLEPGDAADVVRSAAVDVLVDLAGHTSGNRLDVFAERPAAAQVTWLGYPNTTGLSSIEWRITDGIADPEDATSPESEKLVRLPGGFLCFEPWPELPEVSALPATRERRVTFGSFNNLAKVSDATLDLFARVLARVKDAHLLVKAAPLRDPGVRARVTERLEARGVSRHRVRMLGEDATIHAHLARYGQVDVALDTFPYGGTTTTFEATLMGVPTVTLVGDRHAARVGASIVSRLGHSDWAAKSPEAYVEIAAELARDEVRLASVRAGLRGQLLGSSLTDAVRFAREMEDALLAIDTAAT